MVALSVVISLLPVLLPTDCTCSIAFSTLCNQFNHSDTDQLPSFAFVEYESRHDADDAYHEMHNKRIGRDDILKIEVRAFSLIYVYSYS